MDSSCRSNRERFYQARVVSNVLLDREASLSNDVSSAAGYAENAQVLIEQWRDVSFADRHEPVLHLIPARPSSVLDVGAGIGTDAAALAALGHRVVAVEPVDAFRIAGANLHPLTDIEWVDDSLPDLAVLRSRAQIFDLVMLTAVWMHLDERERRGAMSNICALLRENAKVIMSLRHGPVPHGRRMFDVSAQETIELAEVHGLRPVLNLETESVQRANRSMGVTWTRLAFINRA
jgi:SAM-dependent methyltransferase